eukprot:13069763-Ditylum_brightwellii.AAC.1
MECTNKMNHVKGHQDKDKLYSELDLLPQLSVDVDFLPVEFWSTCDKKVTRVPQLPANKT